MRALLALSLLTTGCGRFGFEPGTDGGAGADTHGGGDGSSDAAFVAATAMPIAGFDLASVGSTVYDIAAARTGDGFALGFIMDPESNMYGVHLGDDLTPNTAVPFQTSPIAGFSTPYNALSLAWNGSTVVGSIAINDGTMYLKTFQQDMMTFGNAIQKPGYVGEPSVGRAGNDTLSTWFVGTDVLFNVLDANGVSTGGDVIAVTGGANIVETSSASGNVMLVATEYAGGTCSVHSISATGPTKSAPIPGACSNPYAVSSGSTFVVAYETSATTIALRSVSATGGAAPTVGLELATRTGRAPRVFEVDGEQLLAYIGTSELEIVRLSDLAIIEISALPNEVPNSIEVAGKYVFATYGSTVYAVTPD